MNKTEALKNLKWIRTDLFNLGVHTYGWKCLFNGNWVGHGRTKAEALKEARINIGCFLEE